MLIQADAGAPLIPWWVLFAVLLGTAWGTWRLTRHRWWAGLIATVPAWMLVLSTATLALPNSRVGLMLLLSLVPGAAFAAGIVSRRGPGVRRARAQDGGLTLSAAALRGQPSMAAVMRSKVMEARYAAGMPRNAAFVVRMRDLSPGATSRPVDLFLAGGVLWIAPLADAPPQPIPLRDVLRVDPWSETDGPPTLRLAWSPPAGELTRDLVLASTPATPANAVELQVRELASALQARVDEDALLTAAAREAEPLAAFAPPAAPPRRFCARCGRALQPGAASCAHCGAAVA